MPLSKEKVLQYPRDSLQNPTIDFREDQSKSIDAIVNQNKKLLVVQKMGWGKSGVYLISTQYKLITDGEIVEEKPLGRKDLTDLKIGEISRTIQDDTMQEVPIERTIVYVVPFEKYEREKDYEVA